MSTKQLAPTPKTFHIGGIPVHVYGLSSRLLRTSSRGEADRAEGVTVLFFLHGRFGHSLEPRYVRPIQSFLDTAERVGKKLAVVAFDQRNHGQRTVDKDRNKGWKDDRNKGGPLDNESHAGDMMAIQQPRITLGIPIVGSPDMRTLLTARAKSIDLAIEAPHFPSRLLELWQRLDPVHAPSEAYERKRILILSGADDELVNYVKGGTEDFVATRLNNAVGQDGCVHVWVQENTGHTYSERMIGRTCQFLVEEGWGLSEAAAESSDSSVRGKSLT
ncbi:BQ2448_7572 [Microbotryum intermedium]|uniref:BQ2448_7572 protein n=1 Tax=Microbotryum intermedium TaxID=269621 RepID=A0A238FRE4_9BASI|nr:BQ2448_7572 [Microbotryum intermedium]